MQPWVKSLGMVAVVILAVIGGYVVARATLPTVQQGLDKLRCPELSSTHDYAGAKRPRNLFDEEWTIEAHRKGDKVQDRRVPEPVHPPRYVHDPRPGHYDRQLDWTAND